MVEIEGYQVEEGLYYTKDHVWAKVEGENVRVGADDYAGKTAGEFTYVDLPFEGDEVEQGETLAKVQSSKWVGKLAAPVSGEIVEVNEDLDRDASLLNKDPYGKGWIALIKATNLESELRNLISGDAVKDWMMAEAEKAEKEGYREKAEQAE
ncbi:MAG: glycine cleavage system protein GcvH [Actinomycetota bacterium]